MTFGFFRARILTHFRAAALGFEPKLPGSLAIVSDFEGFSRELSSHYIIHTNCNALYSTIHYRKVANM